MPIYAYKCDSCGFAKDVLQKLSDAPLSDCPSCGSPTFKKQLTAAGFQLKGSGWYVTDFKGGDKGVTKGSDDKAPSDTGGGEAKAESKPVEAAAAKQPEPSAAPAAKTPPTAGSGSGG